MINLIKRKGGNPYSDKPQYYPRWTSKETVTTMDLAKIMSRSHTYDVGETHGTIIDFSQYVCDAMLDGKTVEITGLGTFRLSVNGKAQLDPKDVTAEGVKVNVLFTPCKDLRARLDYESEFQFVETKRK